MPDQHFQSPEFQPGPVMASPRRSRWWLWLIGAGGLVVFSCVGCIGLLGWIGVKGPDTAVYAGHAVPTHFVEEMRDVGALEEGEQIVYFYSAAFLDITDTFCFVSDRKTAIYASAVEPALTIVRFDDIADANLYRDESFFVDSEIVLQLADGTPVSFLVSSEREGDLRFYEAIRAHLPDTANAEPSSAE